MVLSLVYSIELAIFGIMTLWLSIMLGVNKDDIRAGLAQVKPNVETALLFIPIFTNAAGGILVGIVTQRAGGVKKGMALICGICLTGFVEYLFGRKDISFENFVAVLIVCVSIWLHISNGATQKNTFASMGHSTMKIGFLNVENNNYKPDQEKKIN